MCVTISSNNLYEVCFLCLSLIITISSICFDEVCIVCLRGLCCSLDCDCMLGVHCLSGSGHEASNSVILLGVSETHGCYMLQLKEYEYVIDWQGRELVII